MAAGFATYRAFHQDLADNAGYPPLTMPTLVLGGESLPFVELMMAGKATDISYAPIKDTGHYIAEEQPEALAGELMAFFS